MFPRACRAGTRDFCSALGCSCRPCQNMYTSPHHTLLYFNSFVPIAQPAGQAASFSLSIMCLWRHYQTVACTEYSASPSTHQQVQCNPRHTLLPFQRRSAVYSQPHFDNFGNFVRRIAFALASTFSTRTLINDFFGSYFDAIFPIQAPSYLLSQD